MPYFIPYEIDIESIYPLQIHLKLNRTQTFLLLPIHVYGFEFDLYMNHQDSGLSRMGTITHRTTAAPAPPQILWSISPQQSKIQITDLKLHYDTSVASINNGLIPSIMQDMMYHLFWKGHMTTVTSAGIVYLQTHGTRFTLTSICENKWKYWHIEGKDCQIYKLQTGWKDNMDELRSYVSQDFSSNTSNLTQRPWSRALLQLAYEEALQSV